MTSGKKLTWILTCALATALAVAGIIWGILPTRQSSLPYHDSFAQHEAREWTPLGGSWRIQDGAVINWSDASGSKIITGSPKWSDYQVTSDMRLLAHDGDIGLIVRVDDASIGIDSYHGYYVGLRSSDNAIVMGRADHSWLEDRPIPMDEPIQNGRWYRLHVVAVGCTIAVETLDLVNGAHGYAALHDDPSHCIHRGQMGLRSTDTSSAWKNVSVSTATQADLQALLAKTPEVLHPDFPIREDAQARMRARYFPNLYPFPAAYDPATHRRNQVMAHSLKAVPLTTTLALRREPQIGQQTWRLHGVITSISPFYLQDATGGIQLSPPDPGALCIGDEVDLVGYASGEGRGLVFVANKVEGPTTRSTLSALSITPSQAISGAYEGSLVECMGQIIAHRSHSDGSVVLVLNAEGEDFEALLPNDPFASTNRAWRSGSNVRVRGIYTIAPDQRNISSFTILVQSLTDVTVLAGPSWLVGWRLLLLVLVGLLLSGAVVYLLMLSSRARANAITEERERLSHEIHDTLAQSFAGVSYHLQGLRKLVREAKSSQEALAEELDTAYEMVAGTHREASAIIATLHPSAHKDGDLLKLIERAASSLFEKHGPQVRSHRHGEPRPLSPAIADALFRVALEAVANILRHSQATTVDLSMNFTSTEVMLTIEDNGVGFRPEPSALGFGLRSMQKRCSTVRARLHIASEPGKGTRLTITARHQMRRNSLFARSLPT
jgi:signal transduction histidine kinase